MEDWTIQDIENWLLATKQITTNKHVHPVLGMTGADILELVEDDTTLKEFFAPYPPPPEGPNIQLFKLRVRKDKDHDSLEYRVGSWRRHPETCGYTTLMFRLRVVWFVHLCFLTEPSTMNTVVPFMIFPQSHAMPERWPCLSALGVRVNVEIDLASRTIVSPRTACISPVVCSLSCTGVLLDFTLDSLCFLHAKCLDADRGPSPLDQCSTEPHSRQVLSPSGVVVSASSVPNTALCIATCIAMACCSFVVVVVLASSVSEPDP